MKGNKHMKTKRLLKYPSLALVTGLAVFAVLWATPEGARGQVVGGDLFASVNLGGTFNNGVSPIYQYDSQYVPPGGTPNIFASGLDTPRGLAFDNTPPPNGPNLYVANNNTVDASVDPPVVQGSVLKFSSDGLMSTFATGFPAEFFVSGLATDSAGDLFVTAGPLATDNNPNPPSTIYKITPDGALSSFAPLPGGVAGTGLACDSAGNVYVANSDAPTATANGEILKFTPAGAPYDPTPTGTPGVFIGPTDFPYGGGQGPSGLAFDASGNLFVSTVNGNDSTGEIRKFASDGTEITPRFATGLTKAPRGLAFDGAGNLFLAELGIPGTATTGDILQFTPPTPPSTTWSKSTFASQNFGTRGNHAPEWLAFTTGAVTPPTTAVTLTLPDATAPLTATITYIDQNSVPPPPANFVELSGSNLAFDISTTATPTPPIIIAFTLSSSIDPETFSQLRALHYECDTQNPPNCGWQDRTIYPGDPNYPPNPVPNTIYGSVSSLSPFLVAKFEFGAQVQQPINADGTSVFSARRGVIPLKFTLTDDGSSTCTLPPATIAVTRTAGGTIGAIDESVYSGSADTGSNFRIASCQYAYNLSASALGVGSYRVDIKINGTVVGSGVFGLK